MRNVSLTAALLLAAFPAAAWAQTTPAAPAAPITTTAPMTHAPQWRASKLIGVDVYNAQNEKLGDINEVLLDQGGKVAGLVIGVGGFLGLGEHDIMVEMDKLKFVNEPMRSTTTTTTTTTGTATTTTRSANERWYPDHAVLSATKDQLKAMPQFKYDTR